MMIPSITNLRASLEQDGLGARAPAKGKSAHGFGGSVVKTIEHLVQALVTQAVQESFTGIPSVHAGKG